MAYDDLRTDIEVSIRGRRLPGARVWSLNPLNGTAIVQLDYSGPLVALEYNPNENAKLPFTQDEHDTIRDLLLDDD